MLLCVAGLAAINAAVRCTDAAREAARLAARGDQQGAGTAARTIAPTGAELRLRRDGGFVVATVSVTPKILLGVPITAAAVAAAEPDGR